ncbi:AAA family ATPase [Streptomyces sp. NPDC089424]|uniref:AAA family ATPase n=1 Tax=Streptomyces sp. NPDC089424 TaxID=3365917 RepID=UPI0037FE5E63
MSLIGRRAELAAVDRLLDRATAGHGGHLVVSGPRGSGRTALADAATDRARARGFKVLRAAATPGADPWAALAGPATRPARAEELASALATGDAPRLLVVDDLDLAGETAVEVYRLLASRADSGTAALVTTLSPLGVAPEVRLGGLTEPELADLTPGSSTAAVHALWLASGGLPGPALTFAAELAGLPGDTDPVLHLALTTPSRTGFLDVDTRLVRLLEAAAERPLPPTARARVLARLARELLGDASTAARRRRLAEEAAASATASGDPGTIAAVLDSRLHALWDPAAAGERLTTASTIVEQARRAGDTDAELRGLFWRFVALMELGETERAESALTAYARAAELAGDAEASVVVPARQAMLATVRGRFDEAAALTEEVEERGRRAGLADTERLAGSLRSAVAVLRGDAGRLVAAWQAMARRLPGHFFEATAARLLVEAGSTVEAGLELERLLPAVLAGSGPRWLGAAADLAVVASRTGDLRAAHALHEALTPYAGRLVVWGGANTVSGPVDDHLGRLALRLGRADEAVALLGRAAGLERRIGALPWLAHTSAARADALTARGGQGDARAADEDRATARSIAERLGLDGLLGALTPSADTWVFVREGDDWRLEAGSEQARLRHIRGMTYLHTLLAAPGRDIAALDLVAGGTGLPTPSGDPVLDPEGRAAYLRHLRVLDEQLDAADRAGDADRARALGVERTALLAELRRHTSLGGRGRPRSNEAERARVNATRALRTALTRIEATAPLTGAHLRASLHTGGRFAYRPAPDGPAHWRT